MKRRIRKKLHVGEYQEFGFTVKFHVRQNPGDPDFERFWDDCIDEIERLDLGYGGRTGAIWDGFVVNLNRHKSGRRCGSVSEKQRQALQQWLEKHPRVFEVTVCPLIDVWYGPF